MVLDDTLSAVLSDFARTMLTDFDVQSILELLVERIVDILPVTGAGVTLIAPGRVPRYVAASDASALRFEQLQSALGQGPCLTAYETGSSVAVAHLAADDRYPDFGPAAVAEGLAAVFTFPLRQGNGRLGALDLYRNSAGDLDSAVLVSAQTLADVASAYLLNAQARRREQRAVDRFRHIALHDALTGLPNRMLLQERLDHASRRAHRSHTSAAVLFMDLDRFKRVNDTYGHAAGDTLLVAVAQRLTALLRPGDTLARVSGDEFVLLCEDLSHPLDAGVLATRVQEAFAEPFDLLTVKVPVTASVGVAYAGPGDGVAGDLLAEADSAMYHAKRLGGARHHVSDPPPSASAPAGPDLARDLRAAASRDELELAYQPIVQAADGVLVGVEALLRWTHPRHGPVPAASAVGLAEADGCITAIGTWALQRACRSHRRWQQAHPGRALHLAVNTSPHQVLHPGYVCGVVAELEASGMDPASLVLKFTEGVFLHDGGRARRVFDELREAGVRLALDDFGTGFSSLSYLGRFPFDILKIDQSFVAHVGSDHAASTIVTAVVELAHGLGMTVIAEGVETERQRDALVSLGCELAQGYLYGPPMPESDMTEGLARTAARQATHAALSSGEPAAMVTFR